MSVTITQIDNAITQIVTTGQSIRLPDGQSYDRASLEQLRALRADVLAQQAAAGGNTNGYGFYRTQIRTGGN